MPLETLFISGPSQGGKTTVARLIAEHVVERPVHFLRLTPAADEHTNCVVPIEPSPGSGLGDRWASAHQVTYTAERVFETLPDGLRVVRRQDRRGFVVIEADTDPALRHAFPYDYRLFVMASPNEINEVFRTPKAAAAALQQVMQDTAAFASEIFGLFDAAGLDDNAGVEYHRPIPSPYRQEALEELDISESQIRQFLSSPIGAEIASRIQLQPDYHAMVESDVVVINTGIGPSCDATDECVKRVEKLLARVRHDARRHSVLYWGDVTDVGDPTHDRLLRRLKSLLSL